MFKSKYKVGELFEIPIYVEASFLLLLLLFVVNGNSFLLGISCALVLAFSVTVHELAHSLTARAFGYHTRDITLSLLGGCASLIALPRKAYQELLTALAGPLASFALALLALSPSYLDLRVQSPYLAAMFNYAAWMNLMLGGFNLLPGFPMDGGRIFRSLMRAFMNRVEATKVAMIVGRIFAILLALRGVWLVFSDGSWGLISIFIAWMIWKEGYREYLVARAESDFRCWTQADFDARVSPPPYER